MHTHMLSLKGRQHGFSLTEIMVGMVIGLLGIIIIMQVTSVFEGQKRTTSSGDDAQNSGAIALFSLQRDVSQAGYGLSSQNLTSISGVNRSFVTPFVTFPSLTGVVLNHASLNTVRDAETDTFIVIFGNSNTTPEGGVIVNSSPAPYTIIGGTSASGVTGTGGHGFADGDYVIADDGTGNGGAANTHYLLRVAGVNPITVPVTSADGYPIPLLQDTAAGPHPLLFNLGPSPSILAYAVRNGSLSVCDYLTQDCANAAATWQPLTGDIVSMRAQCVGESALRVALVARNSQIATTQVTTATPIWNPNGASAAVAASPSTSWGADWGRYRYKTFETIIPIRNSVWSGAKGC